tara:strand:- start:26 stop:223 length:198 start_codon:yes stop_codon:yes gene_type:complete
MDFSKAVRIALAHKGVNQSWLANQMMITKGGMSLALSRGTMSIMQVSLIAKKLDLKTSELIALGE